MRPLRPGMITALSAVFASCVPLTQRNWDEWYVKWGAEDDTSSTDSPIVSATDSDSIDTETTDSNVTATTDTGATDTGTTDTETTDTETTDTETTDTETTDTAPDFCEEPLSRASPGGPDCVTATLSCGESIEATTEGGSSVYGEDGDGENPYENWYCLARSAPYRGTERVYALTLAAENDVTVVLESPCEDLDLVAVKYTAFDDTCPTASTLLNACEGSDDIGDDEVLFDASAGDIYLIIVESKTEVDANFKLSVSCDDN